MVRISGTGRSNMNGESRVPTILFGGKHPQLGKVLAGCYPLKRGLGPGLAGGIDRQQSAGAAANGLHQFPLGESLKRSFSE